MVVLQAPFKLWHPMTIVSFLPSWMKLSKHNKYNDIAKRVARCLNLDDPATIRRTSHNCYSQQPKLQSIRFLKVDHLIEMLTHYNETSNILYYEVSDIPLLESHATNDNPIGIVLRKDWQIQLCVMSHVIDENSGSLDKVGPPMTNVFFFPCHQNEVKPEVNMRSIEKENVPADGVKGYRLWDPTSHKVVVSRDVVFMEDKIQENEEGDSTTRETTSIQMEKEFQSNDSFEAAPQHEVNETNESQALATRTLNRERKRPRWHSDYVMKSNKEAMQEEIKALHKNKTWELVPLPGGRKPIRNKWVYKIKRNGDDQVERYRARLVVKGYAQKEGIDFNEIFSPVVRMTTIRVVLAMCATYDLHLEQLDVKTAFLHGNLEEEIYMLQPKGFEQKGKENLVCRFPVMSSDNASSAVTYTSISSYSDGPSWGIPLMNVGELSEMDPYEEVAQQGQTPPLSPAYVHDLMELDEHVPLYVPEPEHPEYHVPSDDDMKVEDQPYADDASPTAESPGYIADSESMEEDFIDYPDKPEDDDEDPEEDDDEDPEEDPSEEHEPEDDDKNLKEDPSEEHEPEDEDTKEEEPSKGSDETESFKEDETTVTSPPPGHRGERISVRPQTPMAASTQALIDAFVVGSPLFPLPPTSSAYDQAPLGHRAAMIRMRDDILEEDMPPRRRFVLTAPPPGCDVAESSAAARPPRGQYDFVNAVEAGQGLIRSLGHDSRTIARDADR
ncbi:reverse transcriptase domain-containing protein, partial [Tanacetum coccineum]